ncbi:hypothetical protein RhiJN_08618 [Ceratobasidium sp. AG-Ba]|nr:hypothetical protein RhiJN_08618 [Ceratobasidium sp. AG-Ba]
MICDGTTGNLLSECKATARKKLVTSVAISHNGNWVVSAASDRTIQIWDMENGTLVREPLVGHLLDITSAILSPEGQQIITGSLDKSLLLCDTNVSKNNHNGTNHTSHEAKSGPSSGWRYKLPSFKSKLNIAQRQPANLVVFSPDSQLLAFFLCDDPKNALIWNVGTRKPIVQAHIDHFVISITFSSDSQRVFFVLENHTFEVWDTKIGTRVGELFTESALQVTSGAFSPDGQRVAFGLDDKTVRLWDIDTRIPIGNPLVGHSGRITSVGFSPDGDRLVSSSVDGTVQVWDTNTGGPVGLSFRRDLGQITYAVFSPDGSRLASGSDRGTVQIWDANSGKLIYESHGHIGWVTFLAFSLDGRRLFCCSVDDKVQVWDGRTGAHIKELDAGPSSQYGHVSFSPDGRHYALSNKHGSINVLNLERDTQIGTLLVGHKLQASSVAFSADGLYIASVSDDMTLRVWVAKSSLNGLASFAQHREPSQGTLLIDRGMEKTEEYNREKLSCAHRGCICCLINYCSNDGWVSTKSGELLFWLPYNIRQRSDSHKDHSLLVTVGAREERWSRSHPSSTRRWEFPMSHVPRAIDVVGQCMV